MFSRRAVRVLSAAMIFASSPIMAKTGDNQAETEKLILDMAALSNTMDRAYAICDFTPSMPREAYRSIISAVKKTYGKMAEKRIDESNQAILTVIAESGTKQFCDLAKNIDAQIQSYGDN